MGVSGLKVIDREIDRTPLLVQRFGLVSGAHVSDEPALFGADFGKGALGLDQRRRVGAANIVRPPQLDRVVLPEADRTDLVATGRFAERDVPTARARITILRSIHDAKGTRSRPSPSTRMGDTPLAHDERPYNAERVERTGALLESTRQEVRKHEKATRAAMRENLGTGPEFDLPAAETVGEASG